MSVKEILIRILNRLPKYKLLANSVSYTTANVMTWEYTNISINVPTGHMYIVTVQTSYSHGKPYGLGFHTASTLGSWGAPNFNVQDTTNNESLSRATFMLTPGTWYLYNKRMSTGANTYTIEAVDINKT